MDISQSQNTDNLAETPQQPKISDTLKGALEHFDLLPSKVNRHIFKHGYFYFVGFLVLYLLLNVFIYMNTTHDTFPLGNFFVSDLRTNQGSVSVLFVAIGAILLLFAVKIWQEYVPKLLQDLIENKRISAPGNDIATCYQEFLEGYRRALSGPVSYLPSVILVICYMVYEFIVFLNRNHDNFSLEIFSYLPFLMMIMLLIYSIGITLSAIFISGRYLRKLLRDFQVRNNPTHPDKCGGLKILGNFCWRLALPLLAGFIFVIVNGLAMKWLNPHVNGLPVTWWVTLLIVFVLALPITIWASIVPLWMLHTQMLHDSEIYQQNQSIKRDILQNQMRHLLDENELEQAKVVKEKRELEEALYTSYPTWPFIAKVQIFSTLLLSIFSAALSAITPALVNLLK